MTQPSEAHIAAMEKHYGVTYEGKTGIRGQDAWSAENYLSLDARSNGERHFIPGYDAGRRSALEDAAKSIYWHLLEMTAFMGLPEHKRIQWAKTLQNDIRALADHGVISNG